MGTKLKITLSTLCTQRVEREGQELRSRNALRNPAERRQADGSILFTAKAYDAFNFVDHPVLITNSAGTRVREYRCNCPDYVNRRSFCEHCAALALEFLPEREPERGPISLFDLFPIMDAETEEVPQEEKHEERNVTANLGPASVEELSYWFCNCAAHLYPGRANPRIPLKRYQQVFGNNPKSVMLHRRNKSWGGSCSGITFTSAMLALADGITVTDFSPRAKRPFDLQLTNFADKLNMTLHEFIEAAQIVQYSPVYYVPRSEWMNHPQILEKLAERVSAFQATGENPVGMSIYADLAYRGGHSVLPYKFERREEDSDVLHIYDPNWPMQTRYAYLEKDEEGQYVNWRFPMSELDEYSGEKGAISMNDYENFKKVWDNRGSEAAFGMMNTSQDLTVMNADGDMLACVTKAGVQSWQTDIFQVPLTDEPEDAGTLLQLPEGQYLVRNDEPEKAQLELSYAGSSCLLELNTEARMAEIALNQQRELACAVISEPGCAFCIEFETMGEEDTEQVKLEGITGEQPLCFARQKDRLFGSGMAQSEELRLYRNGVQEDVSCIRQLIREQTQEKEYETNATAGKKDDETP